MDGGSLNTHGPQSTSNVIASGDMTVENQRTLCVICLETISERGVTNPCSHSFDVLCIIKWLERTHTCPLCKTQVEAVLYDGTKNDIPRIYNVSASSVAPTPGEATETVLDSRQQQQEPSRSTEGHESASLFLTENALATRRLVYHRQLYSLHVGSNQVSRFQELTPKRFRKDKELISRARKWIRRELQVFAFLEEPSHTAPQCGSRAWWIGNPEYLLEWIIAMLKSVNIKDSSGKAEDMLQEILGRNNARLFLHELRAWLRSPFHHLQDWDQHVQYNEI